MVFGLPEFYSNANTTEWPNERLNVLFQIPSAKCGRKTCDVFSEENLHFQNPPALCLRRRRLIFPSDYL